MNVSTKRLQIDDTLIEKAVNRRPVLVGGRGRRPIGLENNDKNKSENVQITTLFNDGLGLSN